MTTNSPIRRSTSEHSLRTLGRPFVLAVLVLTVVLALGVPAVAGAPQAGPNVPSNHTPTTQPASAPTNATAPNASQAKRALAPGAQGTSQAAKNASPGATNNTTAKNGPDVKESKKVTAFAKRLNSSSPKKAKKIIKNNPKKTASFVAAFKGAGISKKTIKNKPKKAARTYLGVINAANALGGKKDHHQLMKCGGWLDGPVKKATCEGTNMFLGGIIDGIVKFVRGIITGIVNAIVRTPVPKHNGAPAFFQKPTNQPWTGLHDSWLHFSLPLGLVEWALMVLGVLFSQVYISNPSKEVKRRELWHRSWKVLFGVLASWAIGAAILWIANGVTMTAAPNGDVIAKSMAGFAGNLGAAALTGILLWFFEGVLFLFLLLLVLAKYAVVFTLMWAFPVLLPLAAIDVGPLKILSSPARGMIDMFVPFAFLTLPTALVLHAGYVVVNSMNGSALSQLALWGSGANAVMILGFWLVAAISPLFVFSHAGAIKGFAAGALGAASVGAIDNIGERVQDAKDRVKSSTSSSGETPPNVTEGTDITDGSPIHRSNDGTLGGPLVSGRKQRLALESGNTLPETAEQEETSLNAASVAPMDPDTSAPNSTAPTMADAQDPELPPGPALSGGDSGSEADAVGGAAGGTTTGRRTTTTTSGTGTGNATSEDSLSYENINRVYDREGLPTGNTYHVGYEKDGEFQPMSQGLRRHGMTREKLLKGQYDRLDQARNETLLLKSEQDGSYYDINPLRHAKSQEEIDQMRRDSAQDVMNS